MARYVPVSFDLVVWALDADATAEDVGAAYELCRQGEHVDGGPDPRIAAFYAAITSAYPDRTGRPARRGRSGRCTSHPTMSR